MTDALPEDIKSLTTSHHIDVVSGRNVAATQTDPLPSYLPSLDEVISHADQRVESVFDTDDQEEGLKKLHHLSAVHRAYDVHNLLAGRESALLAGALTRSLVEGGLAERWISSRPAEEAPRSATLAAERQNIIDAIAESDLSVPNLERWNNPLSSPVFADSKPGPVIPNVQAGISRSATTSLETMLLLPAPLMDVFGMCSHVNHAATWLTAGDDSAELGVTPSTAFAAVLAQAAGTSAASIAGFNHRGPVLDLIAASTAGHDFDVLASLGREKRIEDVKPRKATASVETWSGPPPLAVLDDLLDELREEALVVWSLVKEAPNPFGGPIHEVNLTSALPYQAARDLLWLSIRGTYADCSPFMAPTGARMLLEQGSELAWRFSNPSDSELLKRYQSHMDDATDRKKAVENRLRTRTSSVQAVESLLYPRGRGNFAIDTRRRPSSESAVIPGPLDHLGELSLGATEPFWELAYKLLTQCAHATPLGLLHSVARVDPTTGQPFLSHEMTALSLHAACMGAALTMRGLSPLIANQAGLSSPMDWLVELFKAVSRVQYKAQQIHFLG